jgi:hypothetical protein
MRFCAHLLLPNRGEKVTGYLKILSAAERTPIERCHDCTGVRPDRLFFDVISATIA